MKNVKILLAALAAALVFIAAADSALNGTWVNDANSDEVITLDNGSFEYYEVKGSYTTTDGTITLTPTQLYIEGAEDLGLPTGWYTIDQIKNVLPEYAEEIEYDAEPMTAAYAISGSTLTLTWDWGGTDTYTKQ